MATTTLQNLQPSSSAHVLNVRAQKSNLNNDNFRLGWIDFDDNFDIPGR